MNPFLVLAAALMVGGSGWSFWHGDWRMATIYFAYAVANAVLATIGKA